MYDICYIFYIFFIYHIYYTCLRYVYCFSVYAVLYGHSFCKQPVYKQLPSEVKVALEIRSVSSQ